MKIYRGTLSLEGVDMTLLTDAQNKSEAGRKFTGMIRSKKFRLRDLKIERLQGEK